MHPHKSPAHCLSTKWMHWDVSSRIRKENATARGSPSRALWPHHTGVTPPHRRDQVPTLITWGGSHLAWCWTWAESWHLLWHLASLAQCHMCGTHPHFHVAVVYPFCCCREYPTKCTTIYSFYPWLAFLLFPFLELWIILREGLMLSLTPYSAGVRTSLIWWGGGEGDMHTF